MNEWFIDYGIKAETFTTFFRLNRCYKTNLLNKENQTKSAIETLVENIATFHCKRLQVSLNEITVEFWWKSESDTDRFHFDCDEKWREKSGIYIHPFLSCTTYFESHDCPMILTNITFEDFKYKDFEKQNELTFIFPEPNKHITFPSANYHGTSNIFASTNKRRYMLAVNLWKNYTPEKTDFFVSLQNEISFFETTFKPMCEKPSEIIIKDKDLINFQLFEDLMYKNKKNLFHRFESLMEKNDHLDTIVLKQWSKKYIEEVELKESLKTKNRDILKDMEEVSTASEKQYNRFFQRFRFSSFFTKDTCKWIIRESEQYAFRTNGWKTKRHEHYPTTDLPVDEIKSIFGYILQSLETIGSKIIESYNLPQEKTKVDFRDVFVVKYDATKQNYLDLHCDGSFLSFQVLLSDSTQDFEGGGTYFDDGLIEKPNQGDLLLHCGKMKHCGLPITKGCRYLLVGFINVLIE